MSKSKSDFQIKTDYEAFSSSSEHTRSTFNFPPVNISTQKVNHFKCWQQKKRKIIFTLFQWVFDLFLFFAATGAEPWKWVRNNSVICYSSKLFSAHRVSEIFLLNRH